LTIPHFVSGYANVANIFPPRTRKSG
jgi:hypothetical protein